jgi:hypothetical protein
MQVQDRSNNGDLRKDVINKIQQVKPEMSATQAGKHFSRTLLPAAARAGQLKGTMIKAQQSTQNRSQITIPQQWRWHQLIDAVDGDHRALNLPDGTGVTFGEVEHHFKTNSDEACFLASAGNVSIVGIWFRPGPDRPPPPAVVVPPVVLTYLLLWHCAGARPREWPWRCSRNLGGGCWLLRPGVAAVGC